MIERFNEYHLLPAAGIDAAGDYDCGLPADLVDAGSGKSIECGRNPGCIYQFLPYGIADFQGIELCGTRGI